MDNVSSFFFEKGWKAERVATIIRVMFTDGAEAYFIAAGNVNGLKIVTEHYGDGAYVQSFETETIDLRAYFNVVE